MPARIEKTLSATERLAVILLGTNALIPLRLEAAHLRGKCPNDPADRWTIAVARVPALPLVTAGRAVVTDAGRGYLSAIPL